ncbi:MAG: glycosyltransferase family 39 protein [Candidatus Buchananbacteria bacterium]
MLDLLKKNIFWVIILAILASVAYASFYWFLRPAQFGSDIFIFNTPDETANYFFSSRLAQGQSLAKLEPLNYLSGELNLVHPRSTTVVNKSIVPGSWLGFILLLGLIGQIFGAWAIPVVTPIVSGLAIVCFYLLLKNIFRERVALVATFLLIIFPAFWYYNARALFNNILFIDLIIIGLYFFQKYFLKEQVVYFLLANFTFGLALILRTSEIFWVGVLLIGLLLWRTKTNNLVKFALAGLLVFFCFVPVLIGQQQLFNSPFVTGYVPEGLSKIAAGGGIWSLLQKIILPHGLVLKNILYNFYGYWLKIFWLPASLVLAGLVLAVVYHRQKRLTKSQQQYLVGSLMVSVLIWLFYGSWFFYDNVMQQVSIGSSQVRYFLPFYLSLLPWAAYFIDWLALLFKKVIWQNIILIVLLIGCFFCAYQTVVKIGPESLAAIKQTIGGYQQINQKVRLLTEENSIIISSYSDKIFFPTRKVIFYWQEPRFLANISLLAKAVPVYFYSSNQTEIDYLTKNSQLTAKLVGSFAQLGYLYKINP